MHCNINGYLVLTGKANAQLSTSMSYKGLQVPTPSPVGHDTTSCGLLVLPQEDLSVMTTSTCMVHMCYSAN